MPRWEERSLGEKSAQEQVWDKWMDGDIGNALWELAGYQADHPENDVTADLQARIDAAQKGWM